MSESKKEEKEKCFVIMPISDQGDYPMGHFAKVYEQIIKPSVEAAGYEAYRVDENNICDVIINKIFSAIQECPMAICDLSNRNPNVLYELGLRQAYDKPVVLIQDDKTEKIFDISGINTIFYKNTRVYEDVIEARENIKKAILATKVGKMNTLAKIVKASTADFSDIEVSWGDKISVMLENIYSEIKEVKNKEEKVYLHLVTSEQIKGITSPYIQLVMEFECDNPTIVNRFKNEVCMDVVEIYKAEMEVSSSGTWLVFFRLMTNRYTYNLVERVSDIATKFNIEYTGKYVVEYA